MILLRLFWEFFKTGLFAVGGGLATLPFLYEMQEKTGWFTVEDITNMIAVSESTPGPLGVNMASYVGYISGSVAGGLAATLGLVAPSLIIIAIVFRFMKRFQENKQVQHALKGLRAASVAMITAAGLGVARVSLLKSGENMSLWEMISWENIALAAVLVLVMKFWKKNHPIVLIAASGLVGFLLKLC